MSSRVAAALERALDARPADCFQTGIVVEDLEAAMRQLTEIAGYRWTAPTAYTIAVRIGIVHREIESKMCYSLQAPHLELVKQVPGTPWMPAPGNAAHHIGHFVDDVATASTRRSAVGFTFEPGAFVDGAPGRFACHNNPLGIRIEIVQRGLFGDWDEFLRNAEQ